MNKNIELSTKQEMLCFLKLHEQMKGAYFMVTPRTQQEKRAFEFHNSGEVTFEFNGTIYKYYAVTRCTSHGIDYSLNIFRMYKGKFERLDCSIPSTQRSYMELLENALLEVK